MPKVAKSKRQRLNKNLPTEPQSVADAVKVLKGLGATKFDQSVEVAMRLGVDAAQADQIVRGSIVLPHGIGKKQRIAVFARGPAADAAKAAGADYVGDEELAKKMLDGWTDFDVCIAAPDMMKIVGPLGRVLGPRGLMPSPRGHGDAGRGGRLLKNTKRARSSSVTIRVATSTRSSASSASMPTSWPKTPPP